MPLLARYGGSLPALLVDTFPELHTETGKLPY